MIIQFSETELQQLTIEPVARRELPAAYLEEREQVWSAQMERVLARGGHMWNGEIYTLEKIHVPAEKQVVLRMSTCEYKDVVFRLLKGKDRIVSQYGEAYVFEITGVSCVPVTQDGKFVFGIRADRPEESAPPMSGIGGTLNKDEMEIYTFADIRQCMLREIREETALKYNEADLRFFCLNAGTFFNNFWFTVRLPFLSDEVNRYHRPGEFARLVAITQQEALNISGPMTGGFRRWRPYLHLLPYVLDGMQPVVG